MFQNFKKYYILFGFSLFTLSCGIYSFTGSSIPIGVETFQVDYFENSAGGRPGSTVEPGIDRDFTIALQDLIVNQTSLNLVNQGGDIIYSGDIIEFSVTPMAATAEIKAAQNSGDTGYNFRAPMPLSVQDRGTATDGTANGPTRKHAAPKVDVTTNIKLPFGGFPGTRRIR